MARTKNNPAMTSESTISVPGMERRNNLSQPRLNVPIVDTCSHRTPSATPFESSKRLVKTGPSFRLSLNSDTQKLTQQREKFDSHEDLGRKLPSNAKVDEFIPESEDLVREFRVSGIRPQINIKQSTTMEDSRSLQFGEPAICDVCKDYLGNSLEEMRNHAERCEANFNLEQETDAESNVSSPPDSPTSGQMMDVSNYKNLTLPPTHEVDGITWYPEIFGEQDPAEEGPRFRLPSLTAVDEFARTLDDPSEMSFDDIYHSCRNLQLSMIDIQDEWMKLDRAIKRNLPPINIPGRDQESAESKKARTPLNPRLPKSTLIGQGAQDLIESLAYGFEHRTHANSLGRQNPIAQRLRPDGTEQRPQRIRPPTNKNCLEETETETATEFETGPGRRAGANRRYVYDDDAERSTQGSRSRDTPRVTSRRPLESPDHSSSKVSQGAFPSGKAIGRSRNLDSRKSNLANVEVQEHSENDATDNTTFPGALNGMLNDFSRGVSILNGSQRLASSFGEDSRPTSSSSASDSILPRGGRKRKLESLGNDDSDAVPASNGKGKAKSANRSKGATKGWEKRRETMKLRKEEKLRETQLALQGGDLLFPMAEDEAAAPMKRARRDLDDSELDEPPSGATFLHFKSANSQGNGVLNLSDSNAPDSNELSRPTKKIKKPVGTTKASQNMLNRWAIMKAAKAAGIETTASIGRKKDESKAKDSKRRKRAEDSERSIEGSEQDIPDKSVKMYNASATIKAEADTISTDETDDDRSPIPALRHEPIGDFDQDGDDVETRESRKRKRAVSSGKFTEGSEQNAPGKRAKKYNNETTRTSISAVPRADQNDAGTRREYHGVVEGLSNADTKHEAIDVPGSGNEGVEAGLLVLNEAGTDSEYVAANLLPPYDRSKASEQSESSRVVTKSVRSLGTKIGPSKRQSDVEDDAQSFTLADKFRDGHRAMASTTASEDADEFSETKPRTSGRTISRNPKYASSQETDSRNDSGNPKTDDSAELGSSKSRKRFRPEQAIELTAERSSHVKPVRKTKIVTLSLGVGNCMRLAARTQNNGGRPARRKTSTATRRNSQMDGGNDSDDEGRVADQIGREFRSEYDHYQALTSPTPPFLGKRARKSIVDLEEVMRLEMGEEDEFDE